MRRNLRASSHDFGSLLLKSPIVPGVSVVLAPPDASPESRALVRRLLDLHFGRHEVVLVLDGPSRIGTRPLGRRSSTSRARSARYPQDLPTAAIRGCYVSRDPIRLLVVDKEPGGVADALNAGVNAAQYPVIGLVDREADFIPELLLRLIRPMLGDWDRTVAVCGVAPPPPAPGLAGCIGAIESLRLWLARCAAFSAWNRLLPVPGACMLVKRDAVVRSADSAPARWNSFWTCTPPPAPMPRAGASPSSPRRSVSAPPRAPGTTCAARCGPINNNWRRPCGRSGAGGGRKFFGLYCIRGLRPLLETAAYILAAAGWITGLVHPALAALVLVISIGGGIVISMAAVVLRELAEPSGMAPGRARAPCS